MSNNPASFIEIKGVNIAYRSSIENFSDTTDINKTVVIWLGGLASDMMGTKANAVCEWCSDHNIPTLRLDYSGHGESEGNFSEGTLSKWLCEAETLILKLCPANTQLIVCGSSMGGWLALLIAKRLSANPIIYPKIAGLLLLAPAFELTERCIRPRLTDKNLQELSKFGETKYLSEYSEGDGYLITQSFLDDGARLKFAKNEVPFTFILRIIHGLQDDVVTLQTGIACLDACATQDALLTVVRDGDHRLSRDQDIELLLQTLGEIVNKTAVLPKLG